VSRACTLQRKAMSPARIAERLLVSLEEVRRASHACPTLHHAVESIRHRTDVERARGQARSPTAPQSEAAHGRGQRWSVNS